VAHLRRSVCRFADPALTRWANLWRTSGAKEKDWPLLVTLTPDSRQEKYKERGAAHIAPDCVQCCPALQDLLGELGVFVKEGSRRRLLVEDGDYGEGDYLAEEWAAD
jgi:hypothetical protein